MRTMHERVDGSRPSTRLNNVADMKDESAIMSTDERLIYMVNQIARNLESAGFDIAVEQVANHLSSFWDPTMRARLCALAKARPDSLSAIAAAALLRITCR